jgi:hypothetical protein
MDPSSIASRRLNLGIDDSQTDVFESPDPIEQVAAQTHELDAYRSEQFCTNS